MFFTGSEKKLESDFPHFCFQDHRWPEASAHARPLEHRTARSGAPPHELSSVCARLPRGHSLHARHPASLPLRLTSALILPAFCIPSTQVIYHAASVPSFYIKNEKLKPLG